MCALCRVAPINLLTTCAYLDDAAHTLDAYTFNKPETFTTPEFEVLMGRYVGGFMMPAWLDTKSDAQKAAVFDEAMSLFADGTFTPQAGVTQAPLVSTWNFCNDNETHTL